VPGGALPPKKPDATGPLDMLKNKPVLWGAIAGGVLILVVLFFGMARARKNRQAVEMAEALPPSAARAVSSIDAAEAGPRAAHGSSVPALPPSRTEVLLTQLQEAGKNNPELWVGILRGWLSEEEAS
jgi:flagellar biosynthesis/type III secretory pathway M-ring protein FliF/YscJ